MKHKIKAHKKYKQIKRLKIVRDKAIWVSVKHSM